MTKLHAFASFFCILPLHIFIIAPSLTVTVNNANSAVAGERHTLSCTVMGIDLSTATVMYTWKLNGVDIPGASANQYSITSVQVSNAGDVYTCQVAVTASYWDVSGSFGGSGSATLTVTSMCNIVLTL